LANGRPGKEIAMKPFVLLAALLVQLAWADARQIEPHRWTGVERIIAIGDIHGDHDNYRATLAAAGLVDHRGRWSGGRTHLVQLGDIPDRGPDTRRIIEHLKRLSRQAERAGGRVHHLIGNHEAMNVYGDLRYVIPAEYAAFANRRSTSLRDRYYQAWLATLKEHDPDAHAKLPADHRSHWNRDHPLGWVEHRMAWDPRWQGNGQMFDWVMASPVAVQLNELIFVHGGISARYCRNSLASLTEKAHAALRQPDQVDGTIIEDELGPLWYRGLAGVRPVTSPDTVAAILEHHNARHIVIGHTPTSGTILPRYDGRVIQVDTGIGRFYGGHIAFLEATADGLFAGYPDGRVALPADETGLVTYLAAVAELHPDNSLLLRRLQLARQGDFGPQHELVRDGPICGSWP
jgi:hypothetical protein